jgi:putative membrane protein
MDSLLNVRVAKVMVILWYLVGIAGFFAQALRPVFQQLAPLGLILATVLLLIFHEPKNHKSWVALTAIATIGFIVEMIGVNTQMLFGHYEYGNAFGFKIWNTPLTMALNWMILIYCVSALARNIRDTWYFPLIGAAVLVFLDWLIEPVAIATDMWHWHGKDIPIKNYIDWFLISGFFFLMIRILKIEIDNRLAGVLFVMQIVFFLGLNLLIRTPLWEF